MTSGPQLSRRTILSSAVLLTGVSRVRASMTAGLSETADAAYTFAAPLIEMAKVRARAFGSGVRPGMFVGRADLATPKQRTVTMPNNDTVYASAFVDLRGGPAVFTVPSSPGRYASLQVMDFYSNNIAVESPRTGAQDGKTLRVVGPGHAAGPGDVISPTPWLWALGRVVVDGPHDLPAAIAVRDRFKVQSAASDTPPAEPPKDASALAVLAAAHALMQENPPGAPDAAMVRSFASLGVGPAETFDPGRFDATALAQITEGVERAQRRARDPHSSGQLRDGWMYNDPRTGIFGSDYVLRAAVATFGLAALPPQEAAYLRAAAPGGELEFDGAGPWVLHFPARHLPPVNAFWSATIYTATPTGQYFLVDNPIARYSIGDRTPGLAWNPDRSLDIWIARQDPGDARRANWLPAPAAGPFAIILRAYLPKRELLDGTYSVPRIVSA